MTFTENGVLPPHNSNRSVESPQVDYWIPTQGDKARHWRTLEYIQGVLDNCAQSVYKSHIAATGQRYSGTPPLSDKWDKTLLEKVKSMASKALRTINPIRDIRPLDIYMVNQHLKR